MTCKYCNDTKIWINPGGIGKRHPCLECPSETTALISEIQYDKGSGVLDECRNRYWHLNGKHHRLDGPAIEFASGAKKWFLNDKLHRVDGPAIECADGTRFWYLNNQLHRVDGPAVEYTNGHKAWYVNGSKLTEKEFKVIRHALEHPNDQVKSSEKVSGITFDTDTFVKIRSCDSASQIEITEVIDTNHYIGRDNNNDKTFKFTRDEITHWGKWGINNSCFQRINRR